MKLPFRHSLKTRITLFTLVIFILSLWGLSYFGTSILRTDMEELLADQQFSTVSLVASNLNQEIEERIQALEKVSGSITNQHMKSPLALQDILEQRQVLGLLFNAGYYIADREGTAIASIPTEAKRIGINYRSRNHVSAALEEGKSALSEVVIGKALQVPVFSIAVPIRNEKNQVIGCLVGVINLSTDNFLDRIMHPYAKTGGYVIVSKTQRMIVTATDKTRVMEPGAPPGRIPEIDRFYDGYEGTAVFTNPRGIDVIQSVKSLPIADWYVGAQIPASEAYAPIRDMEQRMRLATILLTLIAGGLTWWMLKLQFAPIQTAAEALHTRSENDGAIKPLPNDSEDEIGQLIDGFNRLLVTLREQELSLKESEARLSTIIENEPECIKIIDAAGRLTLMNPAGLAMIEADSLAQVAGHQVLDIIAPEFRSAFIQLHQRVIAGETVQMQFQVLGLKGRRRWLETHAVPMQSNGKTVQLAVTRDIEAQKQAEAELEAHRNHLEELVASRTADLSIAKEAAEAASRAKSTFLSNMSHELRTPMNAIMGLTSMALRRAEDPKLRDQLSKIDSASQHLLNVINDILDISKIEAERLKLEQAPFNLDEVLDKLINIVSHRAHDKGLALQIEITDNVKHLSLEGDALRLSQILINLTGNAIKFTDRGSVTLRIAVVSETPHEVFVRFEVQDTGIGISPAVQKRLFSAFEQADNSMTRQYGGTGLGLAISKRLANLMNGDVGVESIEGQGSTFWLTTRLVKLSHSAAIALPSHRVNAENRLKAHFAGARILLAEDEPVNQEVTLSLLEDVGLAVDIAKDGLVAVEMAKRTPYSLILMDMQMPNMNGIDATRAIRNLPDYQLTPILAMTANAFDEDRQACIAAGMNDHLGKPVSPDLLFETIAQWLEKAAG